ncbi:uncharacterized protein [Drosophila tropicalis]|uniref:uncharacterized protein n=1 Tax=Drosophila tropicalis TaxID=46794 RepID=UPI0035AB9A6A
MDSDIAEPLTPRRCVICGIEPPESDANGKTAYHYPKTMDQARIWQRSMAANNVCLESIRDQCCVCIEHIPEFVARAHKQCAKFKANEEADAELRAKLQSDAEVDLCQCPDKGMDLNRPSVNVLLLPGATLPSYFGKAFAKNCDGDNNNNGNGNEGDGGDEQSWKGNHKTQDGVDKRDSESDTEIFVLESDFKDNGATFPDIDETEVTVLRTPTQEDHELNLLAEECEEEEESCLGRTEMCLTGCTDVLLLGRGLHSTDVCPCECDQCTKKPTAALDDENNCCNPPCCPDPPPPEYFDQPPCGCECEQQVRRELGRVIKKQKNRIRELEELLCRQHKLHHCLQTKVDELYCEFGRVDEDDKTRLKCCANRDPPNCAEVQRPKETPEPVPQATIKERSKALKKRGTATNIQHPAMDAIEEHEMPNRVHLYSTKNPDYKSTERTRHPAWVTTVESSDSIDSIHTERKRRQIPEETNRRARITLPSEDMRESRQPSTRTIHNS